MPQSDRSFPLQLRLSALVPDLVRLSPVVEELDLGTVLALVTDSVGHPRTEVTHAAALFLQHVHAAQAAAGHVRPRETAQPSEDPRGPSARDLWAPATVVEMLPLVLEAGGRPLQRAWLEDPHHPRWGVAGGVHPIQIRQCVGRMMPPDAELTLLAGQSIGMGAALQCHRAGAGPTADDLAQSRPLRAAVATLLELLAPPGASSVDLAEEAGRLRDAGIPQGGRLLREIASQLLGSWARLQQAAVAAGHPPRDIAMQTEEEPGFGTMLGLAPTFVDEALSKLPVVPPALWARARAVLDAVSGVSGSSAPGASPPSTAPTAPRPTQGRAVDSAAAVNLLAVIAARPQLLDLEDGIAWARWLRGLMDLPQAQHQTWHLMMRNVVLSATRGRDPSWAHTIAALRIAQPIDGGGTPIWTESILLTWSGERAEGDRLGGGSISQDMYRVFAHLSQGAPEVVGERLRLIWSQPGWAEALRRWLTPRRLLTLAPAVWRPFLQDPDPATRMFAVQMMGRYHDSHVASAAAAATATATPATTDPARSPSAAPQDSPAPPRSSPRRR